MRSSKPQSTRFQRGLKRTNSKPAYLSALKSKGLRRVLNSVKRMDLLALVNKKVNLVAKVQDSKDALYKIYSRAGRKVKLTLLPTRDIEEIKFIEWNKI